MRGRKSKAVAKKRPTKATIKKKARRTVKKTPTPAAVIYQPEEASYERSIIKNIIDSSSALESEDAVTLAAALSSLTDSLKRISYNYGINIGRATYKLFEERKHYRWHGDSLQDAIIFFEKVGYGYILYRVLTDNVEVSIYRKNKSKLGCNIHSFDAGFIAGFLGAAKGEFVRVSEKTCCNNGADCCTFTTAAVPIERACAKIGDIEKFFESTQGEGQIRQEYQVLLSQPLMANEYAHRVNDIVAYLGRTALQRTGEKVSVGLMDRASEVSERFGLGELEYSAKPRAVSIVLRGAKAKKEFVDISISFLNGMIGERFKSKLRPHLSARSGVYKIVMK